MRSVKVVTSIIAVIFTAKLRRRCRRGKDTKFRRSAVYVAENV
nr:MAG TPA: hypothetical protein [Caudoviricetes sp.]